MTNPLAVDEVMRDLQREMALDHFLIEWASSLKKYEKAEKRYSAIVAAYQERDGDTVEADFNAASDARLRQAIQDCSYYGSRVMVYAASAQLELARGTRS